MSAEHDAETARTAELAHARAEKAKVAKAARKAKLARERARVDQMARDDGQQSQFFSGAQQRTASNQQDTFYYGQRGPAREAASGNAYAPRPTFGPFGGSGRGW